MLSDQSQGCHVFTTNDESSDKMGQNVVADSLLIAAIASSQEGNEAKEDSKPPKSTSELIENYVMDFSRNFEAFCLEDFAASIGKISANYYLEFF